MYMYIINIKNQVLNNYIFFYNTVYNIYFYFHKYTFLINYFIR